MVASKNVPVAVKFDEPTLTRIKALYGDRFEYIVPAVGGEEKEEEEEQTASLSASTMLKKSE